MNKKYTFEYDFLMEKFLEEEPQTLDDDIPDCFNDWMQNLDVQDIIDFAEKYGDKVLAKQKKEILRIVMEDVPHQYQERLIKSLE